MRRLALLAGLACAAVCTVAISSHGFRQILRTYLYATEQYVDRLRFEGRPAPALESVSLSAYRGRPVLLFFWAHWCSGCKNEAPIVAAVQRRFSPQGLVVIGPTRLYGYVAGGEEAPPQVERAYIEQVRQHYYAAIQNMPCPISAANWDAYRTNTTPTIVLIDRQGIVRWYRPGGATEEELLARVQALI